jgi:hypothetical protein
VDHSTRTDTVTFIRPSDRPPVPAPRPRPARLDPRAGQYADRLTRSTFTALLSLAVLAGVGVAQDVFAAVGGAQ